MSQPPSSVTYDLIDDPPIVVVPPMPHALAMTMPTPPLPTAAPLAPALATTLCATPTTTITSLVAGPCTRSQSSTHVATRDGLTCILLLLIGTY
jgi:hypothetical protein